MTTQEVACLGPWFHNLHLPDGSETAPDHFLGDFPQNVWRAIEPAVPADLSGWTALDVGCNGGFYSFELARRGATVTSVDVDPKYLAQAQWAARQYGLEHRIRFVELSVYELASLRQTFDFVWFTGTFYHLRYPLLALDIVRTMTRKLLMFQSLTTPPESETPAIPFDVRFDERDRLLHPGWPRLALVEHQLNNDPTNWWIPNIACVEAVLRLAGFEIVRSIATDFYVCRPVPAEVPPDYEAVRNGLGSG